MTEMRVCLTRGVAIAATVTLTSIAMAQGGDTVATAAPLVLGDNVGMTTGYVNDYDETCPYVGTTAPDVVYYYTPTTDMWLNLDLCVGTTNYDTKMYVYGPSGAPPFVACNDDSCSAPYYASFVSFLSLQVTGGTTYYIVVDGYGSSFGNYTLNAAVGQGPPSCPPGTLWGQDPYAPDESWWFGTSDVGQGLRRYETFPGDLGGDICDLHWWGLTLFYSAGWSDCVEEPMTFEVGFWPSVGGLPDLANPVYVGNHTVLSTLTGRLFSGFAEHEFHTDFDPCIPPMPNGGFVSIRGMSTGVPNDCWLLIAGSPDGDGVSWQEDLLVSPGVVTTDPTDPDIAVCLTGVAGVSFLYLDCPELWDVFNGTGELPIYDLVCTVWHVIWPDVGYPSHCDYLHITEVDDTGGTVPGYLDVCDWIRLEDNSTQEDLGWWHIENITITVTVTFGTETLYLDWAGPYYPWPTWWSGIWHELWPNFCVDHDAYYTDNGAAGLDVGDYLTFDDIVWVIIEIGVDITVSQEIQPPTGRCCVNYDEQCYDDDTMDECYARPGYNWDWLEGGTCLDDPCPQAPTGACCVDDECVATNTLVECDVLGGDWYYGEDCFGTPPFQCPIVILECPPDSLFIQSPTDPAGGWTMTTSDSFYGYVCYDDYVVEEEICDIHFWGCDLVCCWSECDEDPMPFDINFWPDNGVGQPDTSMGPSCSYSLSILGMIVDQTTGYDIKYYATDLDPCCDLLAGWVSIVGGGPTPDTCVFMWWNSLETPGTSWQFQPGVGLVECLYNNSLCLTPSSCTPSNGDIAPEGAPDGCVNVSDLLVLLGYWGANNTVADLDCSGTVNVTDLLILLGNWGQGCP